MRGTPTRPRAHTYVPLTLAHATHAHQHQAERDVGRIFGEHVGRVRYGNAGLTYRVTFDVIHSDTKVREQLHADVAATHVLGENPVGHRTQHDVDLLHELRDLLGAECDISAIESRVVARRDRRLDFRCQLPRDRNDRALVAHAGTRQCDRAAPTPLPSVSGTPASASAISTPANAPASVSAFISPRWPMRNTFPAISPSPAPSEMS